MAVDARDRPVNNQEQQNKVRDKQIATNEAKRELASDVRVSTWAIAAAILVCAIGALLYFK
jgi:hypothetical protein